MAYIFKIFLKVKVLTQKLHQSVPCIAFWASQSVTHVQNNRYLAAAKNVSHPHNLKVVRQRIMPHGQPPK